MNINVRYNLDKAYKKGTSKKVIKKHVYSRSVNSKYLIDKPVAIYLWISVMGEQFKIHSNHKISPKQWDFNNKRPKRTYEHYTQVDVLLNRLKSKVEGEILSAQIKNHALTYEEIKLIVKGCVKNENPKPKSNNFFTVYDEFLLEKKKEVKSNTYAKYETLRNALNEYKLKNKTSISFNNINNQFQNSFKSFLSQEKSLLNSTIGKYFKSLKVFMKWSVINGYTDNDAFKLFREERYSNEVIFLTLEELEAITKLNLDNNRGLERVRDYFLFQCYTGQRFGDIKKLKRNEIVETKDGLEWHLFQEKGNKPKKVVIPITETAKSILMKYMDEKENTVFSSLSNQKSNKNLKKICQMANIDSSIYQVKYSGKTPVHISKKKYELISTHTARKTFVCLSLQKNMHPETIMQITGHENYETMKLYKNIVNGMVKKEFKKAWE